MHASPTVGGPLDGAASQRIAPPVRREGLDGEDGSGRRLVSDLVSYLPAPYQADDFVARFLLIIESIYGPIEGTVDQIAKYFDPRMTPSALLPWLASWLGLELNENWPLYRRRQLVHWAARLYRWRGTRRGLREHLRVYTGRAPIIVEGYDGLVLGPSAALGLNTRLGSRRPGWIGVTVLAERPKEVDERIVRQIVEFQKPAHVTYTLEVRQA